MSKYLFSLLMLAFLAVPSWSQEEAEQGDSVEETETADSAESLDQSAVCIAL